MTEKLIGNKMHFLTTCWNCHEQFWVSSNVTNKKMDRNNHLMCGTCFDTLLVPNYACQGHGARVHGGGGLHAGIPRSETTYHGRRGSNS